MNKRGGLEIGINTVVILVIAMVVIAGGIAFIRGFFGKGTDALDQYFNPKDYPNQATANDPVVFARTSTFAIKSGDQVTIPIGIYNRLGGDKNFEIKFESCISDVTEYPTSPHPLPVLLAGSTALKAGQQTVKHVFIQGKKLGTEPNLKQGNYICTLKVYNKDTPTEILGTTDAIIEITS